MMSHRVLVLYCGLLMSISAFSVDITLPSFPAMVSGLSTEMAFVQWTVTAYIFAAGIGQLFWGSASDRFGRKPTLLIGLLIMLGGQFMAALAPSITLLIVARVVQGFGAAAAITGSRAILRDLSSGPELARNMAMATTVFAIGPIVAPLLGAAVADLAGWRIVFAALGMLTVPLLLGLFFYPETKTQLQADALKPQRAWQNMVALFAHPQSCFFLLISILAMAFMLLILTMASPLYESEFGITGLKFAALFAVNGIGIVFGQMLNRWMICKIGVVNSMLVASVTMLVSTGIFVALALTDTLILIVLPPLLATANAGFLVFYANATSLVLDPHAKISGFAVSIFGFLTQIGSAIIVSILVVFGDAATSTMAFQMFILAAMILTGLSFWLVRKPAAGGI